MGGARPGGTGTRPLTDAGRAQALAALPRLMLVTDRRETEGRDLVDVVEAAVAGGVGLVQLRERDLPETDDRGSAPSSPRASRGHLRATRLNGHPDLARALGVGLHLPAAAPRPAEPPPLYGRAVHDEGEAGRALAERVSYVVVGPVFPTGSKPGHPGGRGGDAREARHRRRADAGLRDRRPHARARRVRPCGGCPRRRRSERDTVRAGSEARGARVHRRLVRSLTLCPSSTRPADGGQIASP